MPLPNPVIPMSIDEFDVMEHRLGWKHEYWDGAAQLSCQTTAVASWELEIEGQPKFCATINSSFQLRKPTVEDRESLVKLFARAFEDAVEYAGWSDEHFQRDAVDSVDSFFLEGAVCESSRVGGLLEHSCGFFLEGKAIAAILLRRKKLGPTIEPIMVDPEYQRFGLGAALLGVTYGSLRRSDYRRLYSRTHLGNLPSCNWHSARGFQEIPKYFASSHRATHFHWQSKHHKDQGKLELAEEMERQANHWGSVAAELEKDLASRFES